MTPWLQKLRRRQGFSFIIIILFAFYTYAVLYLSSIRTKLDTASVLGPKPPSIQKGPVKQEPLQWEAGQKTSGGSSSKPPPATDQHPIQYLVHNARREFRKVKSSQSKTLPDAVREYRRRYGMPPPPHFDKWYEFARSNDVQLIDEFDSIYDMITPFWGLEPKTTRLRAKEALAYDNGLIGIAIRNHEILHMNGEDLDWQRNATEGMLSKFVQHLPDMDLAFNALDEPRVAVPHDDLIRLIRQARNENMPASNANQNLVNSFSKSGRKSKDNEVFAEVNSTRFNHLAYQSTWTHSRMSCPPESPSRILEEDKRVDDLSDYSLGVLGFIYNATAMSDICLTPSLSSTYGFFDGAYNYRVVHDLFPIFSQSKVSSYNDIVYPSPWYWYDRVTYDKDKDRPWAEKQNKLYWRGSTTGGFSKNGGWRRQHRQRLVEKLNAREQALIMVSKGGAKDTPWEVKEVPRRMYHDRIDVHFTQITQCVPSDCDAQIKFFDLKKEVEQQDAWGYKYLLDMDGNAFSGRFNAFLRSKSLTFKLAIFREWHIEWLKPWVHYIPLSLQGNDWLEAVLHFDSNQHGHLEAEKIASESSEWASAALRKEDMEAWLFRMLLEYGRVIDDQRAIIGFDTSSAVRK